MDIKQISINALKDENRRLKEDLKVAEDTYNACADEYYRVVEQNKQLQLRIKELEAIAAVEKHIAESLRQIIDLHKDLKT